MEEKKKKAPMASEETDSDEWLVTYSDIMTLLMTFFVLLFSMSTIDPVKFEQFGEAMGKELGKKASALPDRVSLAQIDRDVKELINTENLSEYVEVHHSHRGVTISIVADILFQRASSELNPQVYPILDKFIPKIRNSIYQIAVEGHTDSDPMRSERYPSNWELSAARASQVVNYYLSQGLEAERFRAIGFAHTRPKKPNTTPENKSQNRRVEITFLAIS
jgi:chemotaxis protein MotB